MRLKFDLVDGALARTLIIRLAPNINFLTICMHHIVGDGWSSSILMRELEVVYKALASGHAPDMPPVPFQYIDYAAWEVAQVRAGLFDRQLAYWTEKLAHAPAVLALPTDRPRPPVRSYRGKPLRLSDRARPGATLAAVQPAARNHFVHDHPGGMGSGSAPAFRTGRHGHRYASRQPRQSGSRTDRRAVRK